MYDVTSRTTIFRSSTGENVGPSTYVLCNPRSKRQNFAPFLSTRSKSPSFLTKPQTDAIYDIRDCKSRIKGGSSLKNRADRFIYKTDDTPGPTRYEARPIQWIKKKLKMDPTKPKLYACAVPYSLTVVAPSIPSKADENGYEIDEDGNIVKVPPDEKIPIELNIKSQFSKSRGWRWSCRTSERFNAKQYRTCGPGPAAYLTKVPRCRRAEEDERYREMARLFTFLPRYVEAEEIKAAKEGMPGPGSYDIPILGPSKTNSKSINPKPFISGSERFSRAVLETPAPTSYKICDCATMHKQFSTKCAPFGVDSPRFKSKQVQSTPGPASYEIKGALQEKIEKKKNPHAIREPPPFNTTAMRKIGFVAQDAECMPSAADYPEDKASDDQETLDIYSSVFKNAVRRFFSPTDKKDFVGPAKYNVAQSFDKNRDRKFYNVGKVPFNTSGPRSSTPVVRLGVPCPTTYKNERGLEYSGHLFCRTPRFRCIEETPGPGLYNIHPRYEKSTYKAVDTHNLNLKENVIRKKLRTVSRDTRKHWMNILKKKKLLKWFDIELDFEERMILLIQELFDKPI